MASDDYRPIACSLHDVLEAAAVQRSLCRIRARGEVGDDMTDVIVRILDVYAESGAEYVDLDDGRTLRLDRLIAVDPVAAEGADDRTPDARGTGRGPDTSAPE